MFKKILVPLDGSDLAASILPHVEDLAKATNAEITLITVASLQFGTESEFIPEGYGDFFDQMRIQGENYLTTTANSLQKKGVAIDWVYRDGGAPAREIISYAENNGYDLIAMATHGKGEIAWVLGSIAEKVVTHSTVPVLLVRVLKVSRPIEKSEYTGG